MTAPLIAALGDRVPAVDPTAFVAPSAVVVGDVTLGPRASVWYGAVVRADAESIVIGADSNVQDGSTLHSDPGFPLVLGERVTVGHRVVLHGARVDDDVLVGMGAVVMNGAHVGSGSIVAAGAVVTENAVVPPGSLVAGVPAKVVKDLGDAAVERIRANAVSYTDRLDQHRALTRVELPPTA
jgi:carbonic anhydrase/acetyltransferase-like protein (isoleucine patch superfamily)